MGQVRWVKGVGIKFGPFVSPGRYFTNTFQANLLTEVAERDLNPNNLRKSCSRDLGKWTSVRSDMELSIHLTPVVIRGPMLLSSSTRPEHPARVFLQ
jgi:hypothetical protein